MRSATWLAVVAVVVAAAGCEKKSSGKLDLADLDRRVAAALDGRLEAVAGRPQVAGTCGAMADAILGDPELGRIGAGLADRLSAEPVVTEAIEAVTGGFAEAPEVQAHILAMMQADPGIDPDRLGEQVGREVEATFEAVIGDTVGEQIGELFGRLDLKTERRAFEQRMNQRVGIAVGAYIADGRRQAAWTRKLERAAGGRTLDRDQAAELYVATAWSEDRLAEVVAALCRDRAVREELVGLVRGLLTVDAVDAAIAPAVRAVAADPRARSLATRIMIGLVRPRTAAGDDELRRLVVELFGLPSVEAAATEVARPFLSDPGVARALDHALGKLWARPSVRTALEKFLDDW